MRGSILHPQRQHALLVGVATMMIAAILGSILVYRLISLRPPRQTEISLQIAGLDQGGDIRGAVYWMDEETGKVPVIGHFIVDGSTSSMILNVSNELLESDTHYIGVYWPDGDSSYVPHMHFLFNANLRKELDSIMHTLWKAPQVRDSLNNLIRSPGLRTAVIDFVFDRIAATQNVGQGTRRSAGNDDFGNRLREDPAFADFFDNTHGTSSRQKLVRDPSLNRAIDELLEELEPHFRQALDTILWSQADEIPNARLIWVARRTMMGSRNPAILLVADTAGSTIRDGATLLSREAP